MFSLSQSSWWSWGKYCVGAAGRVINLQSSKPEKEPDWWWFGTRKEEKPRKDQNGTSGKGEAAALNPRYNNLLFTGREYIESDIVHALFIFSPFCSQDEGFIRSKTGIHKHEYNFLLSIFSFPIWSPNSMCQLSSPHTGDIWLTATVSCHCSKPSIYTA